jgi:hypothetical protein
MNVRWPQNTKPAASECSETAAIPVIGRRIGSDVRYIEPSPIGSRALESNAIA